MKILLAKLLLIPALAKFRPALPLSEVEKIKQEMHAHAEYIKCLAKCCRIDPDDATKVLACRYKCWVSLQNRLPK